MLLAIELLGGIFEAMCCHCFASFNEDYFLRGVMSNKTANRSFNFIMVNDVKSLLNVECIEFSFGCFLLFLNDSMTVKIKSCNCSITRIRFIDSDFQNTSSEVILSQNIIQYVISFLKNNIPLFC